MTTLDTTESRKALLRNALSRLDGLERRAAKAEQFRDAPIAVVGMACRFPGGATTPERYWHNLANGHDAVTEVPPERWDNAAWFDPDPDVAGRTYSRHGGFLGEVDQFDAAFFGIAPRDARAMDPQHRLVLECVWEALERAGIPPASLSGSRTGTFVGLTATDYGWLIQSTKGPSAMDAYFLTGVAPSFIAGRTAHVFGFEGPAVAIDTACSSSLVAVHLACTSLRIGDSDVAVAAGANLLLAPMSQVVMAKVRVLSPSGRCRAFDATADGCVRGEGVGVVVLKRLDDALAAGDPVLAVVRGTAVNQDGATNGLTVPSKQAQERVIRAALDNARVSPHEVSYVEAHGTGTALGDPIELRALGEVYGKDRAADRPLHVGSVKTNFGHTEAAAGIAGFIKAILALGHGAIPPHLHFQRPSPHVDWDRLGIRIPTALAPWSAARRIAGVSAFGASGTNAHVIVEAPPAVAVPEGPPAGSCAELVVVSARSAPAVAAAAHALVEYLGHAPAPLGALASHAALRKSHHEHRLAVVADSHAELAAVLADPAPERAGARATGRAASEARPRIAFVFSGSGAQWPGMARELLAGEPVFRAAIERCAAAIAPYTQGSLLDELTTGGSDRVEIVQPALFAMAVGLAALWRSWGVVPDAVIGHSLGEIAAAHVAGALSLDDAARIIGRRSGLLATISGRGALAVVELPRAEAEARLAPWADRLSVAACNGPSTMVIAGDPAALDALLHELEAAAVFCRRVKMDVAFHSPQVDPLCEPLHDALVGISPRAPAIPMYSTVTSQIVTGTELDARYWVKNLRDPVLFAPMIDRLLDDGHTALVEISPHPVLVPVLEPVLARRGGSAMVTGSLRRDRPARRTLLRALGELYVRGAAELSAGHTQTTAAQRARAVVLPTYPFQRERYWVAPGTGTGAGTGIEARVSPGSALLGAAIESSVTGRATLWQRGWNVESAGFLGEHAVDGAPLVTAALYPLLAAEAARQTGGQISDQTDAQAGGQGDVRGAGSTLAVAELVFRAPLVLGAPGDGDRELQLAWLDPSSTDGRFQIASRRAGGAWTLHAEGVARGAGEPPAAEPAESLASVRARLSTNVSGSAPGSVPGGPPGGVPGGELYRAMAARGIVNGPGLRPIEALFAGDGEVLAQLAVEGRAARAAHGLPLHPALLDGALQAIGAVIARTMTGPGVPLPMALARLTVQPSPATRGFSHARVIAIDETTWRTDVTLWDDAGSVLAEVEDLRIGRAELAAVALPGDRSAENAESGEDARATLRATGDPAARATLIEAIVRTQLAAVLDTEAARLDADTQLRALGLDSLMALELRNRIARQLGVQISAALALAGGTVGELFSHVIESWDTTAGEPAGAPGPDHDAHDDHPPNAELAPQVGVPR